MALPLEDLHFKLERNKAALQPVAQCPTAAYANCSDTELIQEYFAGQARAFKELTIRHQARVRMIAQRYARSEVDAEDIVQETLLKLSRNLGKYRGEAALSTWIYRVTTNLSYDFIQRVTKKTPVPMDFEDSRPQLVRQLSHDPGEQRALKVGVAQALELLPPEQRHAIFLVDYLGFSLDDAADILGVRPGTMKSRRARARAQLRSLLVA